MEERMTPSRRSLDREMRSILAQLELISAIPAAQPASSAGTEHPGGRRPPGDKGHTYYAHWYGPPFHQCQPSCNHPQAKDDQERADVIDAARDELKHLRHGEHIDAANLETPDQARARMLTETVGWTPEQVETSSWTYTRFQVRRYRIVAGRDSETGKLIADANTTQATEDLMTRARQLAERGMTERQIAHITGAPKSTVRRALGRAA